MQGKHLLVSLAAIALADVGAAAHLQPRQDDTEPSATNSAELACESAGLDIYSAVANVPVPSDPAFMAYFDNMASANQSNPCQWVENAPSSIQGEVASFTSAVVAAMTSESSALSVLVGCVSELNGLPISGEVNQLLHFTGCAALGNASPATTTAAPGGGSSPSQTPGGSPTTKSGSTGAASNSASAAGQSTSSKNAAGPRETGVAALGVAAAAFMGVVAML